MFHKVLQYYTTRKQRQSHRHADPRRQQQYTAVAASVTINRANVTVFVTVWPWPLISGSMHADCQATTIEFMCTKFAINSSRSSSFPFRTRTNRQTDATEHSTQPQLMACCNRQQILANLEVNSAVLELSALLSFDLLCSTSLSVITGSLVVSVYSTHIHRWWDKFQHDGRLKGFLPLNDWLIEIRFYIPPDTK